MSNTTFQFAMTEESFAAGLPKLGQTMREANAQAQTFGVAAGQFCVSFGAGKHANELISILSIKMQKPMIDWLAALTPLYMDNKSKSLTFSHKKAWALLHKQSLVPTGVEQKGEVPTELLQKLLPFITGALQGISWDSFKAPAAKKDVVVDKDALVKKGKKLLAELEAAGFTARDIMPQAFTPETATTPSNIAKVNLGNTQWISECEMLSDALDLCTDDSQRQAMILAITRVINNAIGNAALPVKTAGAKAA